MIDAAVARRNMVDSQIRTNKVTDPRVIDAFAAVPRERFVPAGLSGVAYLDDDLELVRGRYLMEPMVMARLIQVLEPRAGERGLDIGTGYGYAAAVLAHLVGSVVAVESDAALVQAARRALGESGASNVTVLQAPLAAGHAAGAPYDVIFVGGAVEHLPADLLGQLAEGGRLATVQAGARVGEATLYIKTGGLVSHRPLFEASTPRLAEFAAPPRFVF